MIIVMTIYIFPLGRLIREEVATNYKLSLQEARAAVELQQGDIDRKLVYAQGGIEPPTYGYSGKQPDFLPHPLVRLWGRAGMGVLVQSSPFAGGHRLNSACRSKGKNTIGNSPSPPLRWH